MHFLNRQLGRAALRETRAHQWACNTKRIQHVDGVKRCTRLSVAKAGWKKSTRAPASDTPRKDWLMNISPGGHMKNMPMDEKARCSACPRKFPIKTNSSVFFNTCKFAAKSISTRRQARVSTMRASTRSGVHKSLSTYSVNTAPDWLRWIPSKH